jgi:hypothetical protein
VWLPREARVVHGSPGCLSVGCTGAPDLVDFRAVVCRGGFRASVGGACQSCKKDAVGGPHTRTLKEEKNRPGLGQNDTVCFVDYRKQGALGHSCLPPEEGDHKGLDRGQVVADFALDTEVFAVHLDGVVKKGFGHGAHARV